MKKKSPISKFHESTTQREREREREKAEKHGQKRKLLLECLLHHIIRPHFHIALCTLQHHHPSSYRRSYTQALTDDPKPSTLPTQSTKAEKTATSSTHTTRISFSLPSLPASSSLVPQHPPQTGHTHPQKNALTSSSLSCFKNVTGDSGRDFSSRPPAFFSRMLILPVQAAHPRTSLRLTCHRQALDTLVHKQQEA